MKGAPGCWTGPQERSAWQGWKSSLVPLRPEVDEEVGDTDSKKLNSLIK